MKQFGLAYDLLVFPKQLPAAIELVAKFPEQGLGRIAFLPDDIFDVAVQAPSLFSGEVVSGQDHDGHLAPLRTESHLVTSAADVAAGGRVDVQLADGGFGARVEDVQP